MSEDVSCEVGSERAAEAHGWEGAEHSAGPVRASTLAAAWISRGRNSPSQTYKTLCLRWGEAGDE